MWSSKYLLKFKKNVFYTFRSRTHTPEPESISKPSQSPVKKTPVQNRARMSLARRVVEANAYSKSSSILESSVSKDDFTSHSVSIREVSQTKESTQSSVTNVSMSINSWLVEREASKEVSNTRIIPVEESSKEHSSSVFKESFSTTKTITSSSALSSPFNFQDNNSSRFSNASRLLSSLNESLLASDVSDAESEDLEPITFNSKPSHHSAEMTSSSVVTFSDRSTTASKSMHEAISESADVSVKSSTGHFAPSEMQDEKSHDKEIKLDSISSTVTTNKDVSVIVKINIEADPSTSAEDSVKTPTVKEIHSAATEVNDDSNSYGLVIDTECDRNECEKDKMEVESIGEEGSLLHSDVSDAEENALESDDENDIDLIEPTTQQSWQTISQDSKEAKSSQSQVSGEKTEEDKESGDSNGSSDHTTAISDHANWESESNDEVVERAADTASESDEENDVPNEESEANSDAENDEGNPLDSLSSNDDLYIEESSGDTANKAYVVNNLIVMWYSICIVYQHILILCV